MPCSELPYMVAYHIVSYRTHNKTKYDTQYQIGKYTILLSTTQYDTIPNREIYDTYYKIRHYRRYLIQHTTRYDTQLQQSALNNMAHNITWRRHPLQIQHTAKYDSTQYTAKYHMLHKRTMPNMAIRCAPQNTTIRHYTI